MTRRAVWVTETGHALDGEWRPNPPGFAQLTLADLFRALMTLVCGRGVAILDKAVAARHGFPTGALPTDREDFKNHSCAVELRSAGFVVREINRWFHVKHAAISGPGVWFALAEFIDLDYAPIFGGNRKAVTAALAEWDRITGSVYRGAAGEAGNALLKQQRYGRRKMEPQWWANRAGDGPDEMPGELPYLRHQWRTGRELPDTIHGHDRVRAYLSAMTCTKVAAAKLVRDKRTVFDAKRSGWWLVNRGRWEFEAVMPDPAGYNAVGPGGEDGPVWLTSPTVARLEELAREGFYTYEILDSWTAPATDVLIGYGTTLREHWDATKSIEAPDVKALVRASMKATYRQGHGFWRSSQSEVQRRDWAGALVAQSRANLHRAMWKLWRGDTSRPESQWFDGPTPIFIETDDVYYGEPLSPDGWTVWDDRDDLDDVTKLGHWRRSKILGRTKATA